MTTCQRVSSSEVEYGQQPDPDWVGPVISKEATSELFSLNDELECAFLFALLHNEIFKMMNKNKLLCPFIILLLAGCVLQSPRAV